MATRKAPVAPKRDRLALTPSPALRAALADLSEALNKPPATIAAELLTEMIPQLEGIAKIARAAKAGNKAAAKKALQHMIGDGMAEVIAHHQPDLYSRKR